METSVTEEELRMRVASTEYVKLGRKTTVCLLTLDNGFEVVGLSACVDPSRYDEGVGRDLAFNDAFSKVWELEGYRLQVDLYNKRGEGNE